LGQPFYELDLGLCLKELYCHCKPATIFSLSDNDLSGGQKPVQVQVPFGLSNTININQIYRILGHAFSAVFI